MEEEIIELWHEANKAFMKGDLERCRELYKICVEKSDTEKTKLRPSFYLSQWATQEGEVGNRAEFEHLFQQAMSYDPYAPMLLLWYARDLWVIFKDADASHNVIKSLEKLLSSNKWDRSIDIAPTAYEKKIETLRAWIRGEQGGSVWP